MGAAAAPILEWAPTALGVAGLYQQGQAQGTALGQASAAKNAQEAALARQQQLFNEMHDLYNTQMKEGDFNPSGQVSAFRDQFNKESGIAANNLAAAAATAGYRPGDTAPMEALAGQQVAQGLKETQAEMAIRQEAADRQRNALNQINGMGEQMNAGQAGAYGAQYNTDLNYAHGMNPAPLIGALSQVDWGALMHPNQSPANNPAFSTLPGTFGAEGANVPGATIPQTVAPAAASIASPVRKSLADYFKPYMPVGYGSQPAYGY